MFSSTHDSQCDSEYNYIPAYIIEDESNYTSHEIGTLEAVDGEILGDYDACLYGGEPLASEECYARYLKNMRNTRNKTRSRCYSEVRRPCIY
jgi:hypothetical protein